MKKQSYVCMANHIITDPMLYPSAKRVLFAMVACAGRHGGRQPLRGPGRGCPQRFSKGFPCPNGVWESRQSCPHPKRCGLLCGKPCGHTPERRLLFSVPFLFDRSTGRAGRRHGRSTTQRRAPNSARHYTRKEDFYDR